MKLLERPLQVAYLVQMNVYFIVLWWHFYFYPHYDWDNVEMVDKHCN